MVSCKVMKNGELEIKNRIIIAPLADISDAPFRKICKDFGADLTFTQMVSAKGVLSNQFDSLRYLVFSRAEKPIGVQILGNDPDIIDEVIGQIKGYKPDLIDLNCGCPVTKVINQKLGASLLDEPFLLEKIITKMVKRAGEIPVSVKLRLGRNKTKINIIQNAKIAENAGASSITVHGRTRDDRYEVESNWEWIKKAKESVSIPVYGNGSLFEPNDIKNFIDLTGCNGVMLARGVIGNPFLISRYKKMLETGFDTGLPKIDEVYETLKYHISLINKEYGEISAIVKAKKTIVWYLRFYNGITPLLNKIFSFENMDDIMVFLDKHIENIKNGSYPEEDLTIIDKKFKERIIFWLKDEILTRG